ncbi:hypothetical protein NECAME_00500 [Necator americanus]|uniref:Uncharacterized protein n=1 Tax=Necator americanus TaxID=51031 RepID=W2T4L8_NECAM|nr:hypothetical protein NECAME_00500 [Necator americanus]ETN76975.1 hypothetical protein NECAME_00500 [Necator americanus]
MFSLLIRVAAVVPVSPPRPRPVSHPPSSSSQPHRLDFPNAFGRLRNIHRTTGVESLPRAFDLPDRCAGPPEPG